ncbi:benzoylformate decarboxylase [Streptomyces sp. NPDC087300]|uniref:benzoylformate decarboxylase n=1 Tax=Streptomyces sp. NPDC087300 TaxID=3365780 RepID=UPI0037F4C527
MTTVRQITQELLRHHDMRVIFGNPGSTELPFLAELPEDFTYVLALNEATATAMADGYAQATGRPALVNLHTAVGLGNAMGSLVNAAGARSPVVALAGQQVRAALPTPALLVNRHPAALAQGAVKHTAEPARPEDTPEVFGQAILRAGQAPAGPVCVSVPMDDWERPVDATADGFPLKPRTGAAVPDPAALAALAAELAEAGAPALIAGPEMDTQAGYDATVALAERLNAPVWLPAFTSRAGFPSTHIAARGPLPSSAAGVREALAGHDLVLALGAPVFTYYQWTGGPGTAPGTRLAHITSDPEEAARAVTGTSWLGSPVAAAQTLDRLLAGAGTRPRAVTASRPLADGAKEPGSDGGRSEEASRAATSPAADGGLTDTEIFTVLAKVLAEEAIIVNETPHQLPAYWQSAAGSRPGSFYFTGGGGLGFGLAGAVGVQLARPQRPVVAVVGDGSVQYTLQALWTAARYRVPLTVLVLDNGGYEILKSWGRTLGAGPLPGVDLPGIDIMGLATGYGVTARRARTTDELTALLSDAVASPEPRLIHVPLAS